MKLTAANKEKKKGWAAVRRKQVLALKEKRHKGRSTCFFLSFSGILGWPFFKKRFHGRSSFLSLSFSFFGVHRRIKEENNRPQRRKRE